MALHKTVIPNDMLLLQLLSKRQVSNSRYLATMKNEP